MAIFYQILGLPEAKGAVAKVRSGVSDTRLARKFIGEEMLARTQQRLRRGIDVHGRPFKPSHRVKKEGGQTLWDDGGLAASVNYSLTSDGLDLYSSDKRARVHFLGLVIRPKNGKYLTIPLRAPGGAYARKDRFVSGNANRTGARASHYSKKSTFFKTFGDRLYLMQKTGDGKLRALFLLVRSVKMPKREWLGYSQDDLEMAMRVLGDGIVGGER